ncbi:uncharacterized protein DC041_0007607 [Schistosoma bovis]|uniref:Uncharacterized protein n=1 Tax=Schistosoma bovis TaxID=6184 RepID=A0A430Q6G5_SCHBO|nr:uncharacterized protein DC041_0007607 [Schistosoma bovis]
MICLPMHPLNCLVTLMLIFQLYMSFRTYVYFSVV